MEERVKKLLKKHKDDKDLTSEMDYIEPGWDWSEADLSGWDLRSLLLSDYRRVANFQNVKLAGSNLSECILTRANFKNSNLHGANLEGAELSYVDFRNVFFMSANLSHASISEANLENAKLFGAILVETTCDFSNLKNTDFRKSKIIKSFLDEDNLQQADFRGAVLRKTDLTSSDLKESKFDQYTKLYKVRLYNCNLERSTLKNAVKNLDKIIVQEKEKKYKEAKEIYILLKNYFRQEGMFNISGKYYYREKLMETKYNWKEKKYLQWIGNIFLKLTTGYGERPLNILISWVIIIFGFTFIYYIFSGIFNGIAYNIISYKPNFLEALYFSIVTFTTLGFGDLAPKPGFFQLFASFEALIGAIFMALFIFVFVRKMIR